MTTQTAQQQISTEIWDMKYRLRRGDYVEPNIDATWERIVDALYEFDEARDIHRPLARHMLRNGFVLPGGRIIAGAGSGRDVTTINCFVMGLIEDSLEGILTILRQSMKTLQKGGGAGHDFSPIRPHGALVAGVDSDASGPLSFMDLWDAGCRTIMSAGYRRGAMMGTLRCDHPDIEAFIAAKREPGRLRNFNLSVLITNAFMDAVTNDTDFHLGHAAKRKDGEHAIVEIRDGKPWYVWKTVRARDLWDLILRSTYDYAEPGVLFIDEINRRNNLQYCEVISSTNPCAEQPLPPNGACDLGHVNIYNCVKNAFTPDASVDFDLMTEAVKVAVRLLDNNLDVTAFPLPEQRAESDAKRRIGLGMTGIGNMLMALGIRYGTDAVPFIDDLFARFKVAAYEASIDLAIEKSPFPMFNADEFLKSPNVTTLPQSTQDRIRSHGIRNGVVLTLAPVGTGSLLHDNVSSGLEPAFSLRYTRKVLMPDNTHQHFMTYDKGWVDYANFHGIDPATADLTSLPPYMVTAGQLSVEDHLLVLATAQKHIDSSISKTINVPKEMPYEAFKQVYQRAFDLGCKGCTTFRPNDVTGSVLTEEPAAAEQAATEDKPSPAIESTGIVSVATGRPIRRPEELIGRTYKHAWQSSGNLYITINNAIVERTSDGERREWPFEVWVQTTKSVDSEMAKSLSITTSAALRTAAEMWAIGATEELEINFVLEHLKDVQSDDGQMMKLSQSDKKGLFVPSRTSLLARVLERHISQIKAVGPETVNPAASTVYEAHQEEVAPSSGADHHHDDQIGRKCGKCGEHAVVMQEGCERCLSCGTSKC